MIHIQIEEQFLVVGADFNEVVFLCPAEEAEVAPFDVEIIGHVSERNIGSVKLACIIARNSGGFYKLYTHR